MEYIAKDVQDLPKIAGQILEATDKKVFLLEGDLGAGKTTLVKAFCRILGSTDTVSSPTFSLINHYKNRENKNIFHFDFYRLNSPEEAMDIGFEEYLITGEYCFIEWPEIILKQIFTDFVKIKIEAEGNSRLIKVLL